MISEAHYRDRETRCGRQAPLSLSLLAAQFETSRRLITLIVDLKPLSLGAARFETSRMLTKGEVEEKLKEEMFNQMKGD